MKTNRRHNQIFKATLFIMTIALFSTTVNAQRRAANNGNVRNESIEQKTDQKASLHTEKNKSNNRNEYRKHTIDSRSKSDLRNQNANKQNANKHKANDKYYQKGTIKNNGHHNNNNHHNKGYKSDWYGSYYSTKWDHHYGNHDKHFKMRQDFHPHFDIRMNPIAFRRVPRKGVWVNIEDVNYVMYHSKFYHSSPFGFYRVYLPTYIKYLPEGCHEVWVNGHQIFRLHGVQFLSTPFGFKVIV